MKKDSISTVLYVYFTILSFTNANISLNRNVGSKVHFVFEETALTFKP